MYLGYGKGSNPEGVPPSHDSSTQISCRSCRAWFSADQGVCPECSWHRPAYNTHMRTERLNNFTLRQQAKAIRER